MSRMESKSMPRKSDKWIPYYFVAFFLFLFVVDGFMVYMAVSTHTGVIEKDAYERGIHYNAALEEKARQKESGWSSVIGFSDDGGLTFALTDRDGMEISGAKVTAEMVRPASAGADFTQEILETGMTGQYAAEIVFPEKGYWEIRITAEKDGMTYRKYKRVVTGG